MMNSHRMTIRQNPQYGLVQGLSSLAQFVRKLVFRYLVRVVSHYTRPSRLTCLNIPHSQNNSITPCRSWYDLIYESEFVAMDWNAYFECFLGTVVKVMRKWIAQFLSCKSQQPDLNVSACCVNFAQGWRCRTPPVSYCSQTIDNVFTLFNMQFSFSFYHRSLPHAREYSEYHRPTSRKYFCFRILYVYRYILGKLWPKLRASA